MKNLEGIEDLIPFLNYLKDNRIWYRIDHVRDDAVLVEITLVGMRLEVDFFDDHIEYSYFEGDESALDDQGKLFGFIRKELE